MKLLFENWRKYLNEANYSGRPLNYSSIVLNDPAVVLREAEKLKEQGQVPPEFIQSNEGRWPHHMTINMGPLLEGWTNDATMKLTVDGWGIINEEGAKAMAFRIDPNSLNGLPVYKSPAHISTLVPPDGKPRHAQEIIDWKDLDEKDQFDVEGVVVAQTPLGKKKKTQKPKPEKVPPKSPVEFVRELALRMPGNVEQIKNIIMRKYPDLDAEEIMADAGLVV
tara:strand:- start:1529 stop:2194 length:666 start_codon:yes stop_codon:yes gene_type:complete